MTAELTSNGVSQRAQMLPDSPADGVEITFKGGQIGGADFFIRLTRLPDFNGDIDS